MTPCTIATGTAPGPQFLTITGSTTSIDATPAEAIGAYHPKYFRNTGAQVREIISLIMLDSRAIVPNSAAMPSPAEAFLYSIMSTDDSE